MCFSFTISQRGRRQSWELNNLHQSMAASTQFNPWSIFTLLSVKSCRNCMPSVKTTKIGSLYHHCEHLCVDGDRRWIKCFPMFTWKCRWLNLPNQPQWLNKIQVIWWMRDQFSYPVWIKLGLLTTKLQQTNYISACWFNEIIANSGLHSQLHFVVL